MRRCVSSTRVVISDDSSCLTSPHREVFNRHGVAYVAIGGVSGMLHGATHYVTQDVDMMVRGSSENLSRIIAALTDGVDVEGPIDPNDLELNTRWRTQSGPIDILFSAVGPNETEITFRELDRSSQLFEVAKGCSCRQHRLTM